MTAYQRARFMDGRRRSTTNVPPDDGVRHPTDVGMWRAILLAALAGGTLMALVGLAVFRELTTK